MSRNLMYFYILRPRAEHTTHGLRRKVFWKAQCHFAGQQKFETEEASGHVLLRAKLGRARKHTIVAGRLLSTEEEQDTT